jgi:hypothetical protein
MLNTGPADAVASARTWQYPKKAVPAARRPGKATAALRHALKTRQKRYLGRPHQVALPLLFAALVVGALALGWSESPEQHLTPKEGLGYWLGITGTAMMTVLLLYSLRKRYRALHWLGKVTSLFRFHMILGIVGPTLIIFHSNFHVESLNATVALVAMLLVVASGIAGRYLYRHLHMGLYGSKAEVLEMLTDISAMRAAIGEEICQDRQFMDGLGMLEASLPNAAQGRNTSVWRIRANVRRRARKLIRISDAVIDGLARDYGWTRREIRRRKAAVRGHLAVLQAAIIKTASLDFYARIFSMWHVLHLPLFFFLGIGAVLHVIAVHLY